EFSVQIHNQNPSTLVLDSLHRAWRKLRKRADGDERSQNVFPYRYLQCLSKRSASTASFSGSSSNSGSCSALGGIIPPLPAHFSSIRNWITARTDLSGMRLTAGWRNPRITIL